MSKQWYMTVGYPGGEFAVSAPSHTHATQALIMNEMRWLAKEDADKLHILIKECPPDVTEWLEATTGEVCDGRQKVPGGWLYLWSKCDYGQGYAALAQSFVPVPGTANITVLEANDD